MILIGFGHKARHGKDTCALAIQDHFMGQRDDQQFHGLPMTAPYVQRIGFADELYRIAREEHGMKEKDAPLLQRIGAERRSEDPEYWIKRAFAKINPRADFVVIPDVRYRNEAEYIKSVSGYLVKVTRLGKDGLPFVDPSRPANHPSEIDLDGYNGWDLQLTIADGHAALTGELAITYAHYLRGLRGKK